ncbi:MAG: hypothetical protein QXJ02_06775 [Candidatus Bathyarchaeia archaeon]
MSSNSLNKAILAAVEEGLSTLGDSPKQAIFYHLESCFKIKKEEIPLNLTDFGKALERLFGAGAPYLENLIVQRLHEKLGLTGENKQNCSLEECMRKIKKELKPQRKLAR